MKKILLVLVSGFFAFGSAYSSTSDIPGNRIYQTSGPLFQKELQSKFRPIVGNKGMVVSESRLASEWGVEILKKGGNAADAAVATAFMLAVTRPQNAALGGGGFFVYCPAPKGGKPSKCSITDYREIAPAKATRDMYLVDGKADTNLSQKGALAAGVPGVVAGLLKVLKDYGTKSRKEVLKKPIVVANRGFPFTSQLQDAAAGKWEIFNPAAKKVLSCNSRKKDKPCELGQPFKQRDLSKVLQIISKKGAKGFYEGWVAKKIAHAYKKAGGLITFKDLQAYKPKTRTPVAMDFHGLKVVSMPPPSNGGTALAQMMYYAQKAEKAGYLDDGFGAASTIHAITHGMSLAYADRAHFFGDSDFVDVPLPKLLSSSYLDSRWKSTFHSGKAQLPDSAGEIVAMTNPLKPSETTHFSVVDKEGNMAAVTTTVNFWYGSGFMPEGTGVFMNNEMDDFSIQPGVPNGFGLVGTEQNAVAPRKKPLSSMSPTIVRDSKGNNLVSIGSAGGSRIPTSVFLSLMNRFRFGMTLPDAVAAARFHHQWKPQALYVERNGFSKDTRKMLTNMGYDVKDLVWSARIHALERFPDTGRVWGVPDRRADGTATAE